MKNHLTILLFLFFSISCLGQNIPDLGLAQSFGIFSGGTLSGNDSLIVHGSLGYHTNNGCLVASTSTCDFNCLNFQQLIDDIDSAQAICNNLTGSPINSSFLNDATFLPGVYTVSGNIQFNSQIILQADSDSVFVFNISDTLFLSSGFSLILMDVNPKNVYFNIGKSLITYDQASLSGIILIDESAILGNNFGGLKSLLCNGNVITEGISDFHSRESLMDPNLKWVYFGESCGLNYLQASAPINLRIQPPVTCTNAGYAQPVTLSITLPATYTIERAYIWYASVAKPGYTFPGTSQITLKDPSLATSFPTAQLLKVDAAQSICWMSEGYTQTAAYRADVTQFITGSGNYIISQIPQNANVDPNGVTLFIVYRDLNNLQQHGTLLIADGLFVNQNGGPFVETVSHNSFAPGNNLIPTASKTFMVLADIESVVDPIGNFFVLNNQSVGITAGCSLPYSQMWQCIENQPAYFSPNQSNVTLVHSKPAPDCYALIAFGGYHVTQTSECNSYSCAGPDQYICAGEIATLTACIGTSYLWSTGATTQSIQVSQSATTTYTVTVTPGAITDNVTVFVSPNPPAPVVSGNTDGCTSNGVFQVIGPNSLYTYTYSATIGGVTTSGIGFYFVADASQNPELGGTVSFIATSAMGCETITTVVIETCCEGMLILEGGNLNPLLNIPTPIWTLFFPYDGTQPLQQGGYFILDPTASNSGTNVHPNGSSFSIDQNLEIRFTDFILFYNQEIVVEPGVTLKISRSSKVKNCTWMWNRILLKPGAHLIIEDNSSIIGGINAIYAQAGSDFQIQDAFFKNNYIGLHLESGNFGTSFIKNTDMRCDLNSNLLFFPYPNEKTLRHIDLLNVSAFDIGDPISLSETNEFANARFGIYAIRSSFTVKNSRFSSITNTQGILSGHGVFADGQGGVYSTTIGGTGLYDYNVFELSTSGIFVRNNYNVDVRKNYFNNITTGSISCRVIKCKQINVDILNNYFNGFGTGILIQDIEGSIVNVKQNLFNNAGSTSGTYGIKMYNALTTGQPNTTAVEGNLIKNIIRTGIWLQNYPNSNIQGINNIIFETAAPSSGTNNNQVKWGIKIQKSDKTHVLENYVQRTPQTGNTNNPSSAFDNKRYGISVEYSNLNTVSSNNLIKLGTGIRYYNSNTNTVTCNQLFHNRIGVSLESSNIGDQGSPGNSQDNKWYDYIGSPQTNLDIQQIGTPYSSDWYAQSALYPWTPDPSLVDPPNFINFPTTTSSGNCSNPCPNCLQTEMYRIVTEEGDYALLTEEELYVLKRDVFLEIQNDSTWMFMNTSYDLPLQTFYDSTMQTSLGQLTLVLDLIPDDTLAAQILVSTILPENHFEENEYHVYQIYLDTWSRDIMEFTQTQYETLYTIATENPITGGPAVYSARVMLDLDIDDFISEGNRSANQSHLSQGKRPIGKVHPNPTNDAIKYRLELENYIDVVVTIEDITGKQLKFYDYNTLINILDISLEDLQPGLYILETSRKNELLDSQKIIKIQ